MSEFWASNQDEIVHKAKRKALIGEHLSFEEWEFLLDDNPSAWRLHRDLAKAPNFLICKFIASQKEAIDSISECKLKRLSHALWYLIIDRHPELVHRHPRIKTMQPVYICRLFFEGKIPQGFELSKKQRKAVDKFIREDDYLQEKIHTVPDQIEEQLHLYGLSV